MKPPIAVFAVYGEGHVNRLLPIVEGFVRRGHRVHMWAPGEFGPRITSVGAQFVDLFAGRSLDSVDASSMPHSRRYIAFAASFLDDLVREVEAVRPAVVVYDAYAVMAPLVAAQLGIPSVNVCAGHASCAARYRDGSRSSPIEITSDECTWGLETLRSEYGFDGIDEYAYYALSPDLNIYCEPPRFLLPGLRPLFEPIAFFGSVPSAGDPRRHGGAPAFRSARRKAYVSFGTIIWRYYAEDALAALDTLSAVLSREGFETVISLGRHEVDSESRAALERPGVRVESFVDQWSALAVADVFVTHHGLNSTHEAIYQEVPMLSYPFFGDQPDLASRCQDLGLAIALTEGPRSPLVASDLEQALSRLEADGGAIARRLAEAKDWEREVMAQRGDVLDQIVALAGSRDVMAVRLAE
jgi:MGT family glycosyltransferase